MRIPARAALILAVVAAGCTPTPPPAPPQPAPAAAPQPDPAASFPTSPPALGAAPTLALPSPVRRTLANGLEVMYVRHGSLPVVHATLITPGGTSVDPANAPGLADFVADMLDEGAGRRDALELSSALDLLGASLSTSAAWDAAHVNLYVLRKNLPQALPIMADVASRPNFDAAEVQRKRQERVIELTRARDEARIIAGNAFAALVFGARHPYGRLPAAETTRRFDRAALTRFHGSYYRPAGSTLILVGDVDPDALHPVVERAFGAWSGKAASAAAVPEAPAIARTTLYLINKPGAAQSEIRVGHAGVARSSPDYIPLQVLNTVLGGSFTSRLNTNLRETHGFAYGASSSFGMRQGAGPFVASSAVFTAKTDSAVVEFLRELRRIRDERVSDQELDRAKRFLALGMPRRFETTRAVAAQLADLETYGQSIDFYNSYVQQVMAVTAEDLQRVANRYLHPDRAAVVVVGDLQRIEAGLRSLNLGPVETRESSEFVR